MGALPVGPSDGMLLVHPTFEAHDGSRHDGFLTPAFTEGDLGTLQPHLFVGGKRFGFWGGMFEVRADQQMALYKAFGKDPEVIFPMRFSSSARTPVWRWVLGWAGQWVLSRDAESRSKILGGGNRSQFSGLPLYLLFWSAAFRPCGFTLAEASATAPSSR
jgi:hypothetical protein